MARNGSTALTLDTRARPPLISVAVFADRRMVREALTAMLNDLGDVRAVAGPLAEAARAAPAPPDVHLLGIGDRHEETLHVVSALRRHTPDARAIVMDVMPANPAVAQFVSAGVAGFVLKEASFAELAATVRAVAGGERVLPQRLAQSLFTQLAMHNAHGRRARVGVRLSRRECEVVTHIGRGLSNKQIAAELDIANHTVKSHVRNIMEKLRLHTRLQIAVYFREHGGDLHHAECLPPPSAVHTEDVRPVSPVGVMGELPPDE